MIRYNTAKNKANMQASQLPNASSIIKLATATDAAYQIKIRNLSFSDHFEHDK